MSNLKEQDNHSFSEEPMQAQQSVPSVAVNQPHAFSASAKLPGQVAIKILAFIAILSAAFQLVAQVFGLVSSLANGSFAIYQGRILLNLLFAMLAIVLNIAIAILLLRGVSKYPATSSPKLFFMSALFSAVGYVLPFFTTWANIYGMKGDGFVDVSPMVWVNMALYNIPVLVAYLFIAFDLKKGCKHLKISRMLILGIIALLAVSFFLSLIRQDIPSFIANMEAISGMRDVKLTLTVIFSSVLVLVQRVCSFCVPTAFALILWKMIQMPKVEKLT